MFKRVLQTFMAVFLVLSLGGCFLVPFVDSFKSMGVTREDRMRLLAPEIRKYEECLSREDSIAALTLVERDKQSDFSQRLRALVKSEKRVDHKVAGIDFSEDAYQATAEVLVRAYKVPYYVVKERTEYQEWRFDVSHGWKLSASGETKEDRQSPS